MTPLLGLLALENTTCRYKFMSWKLGLGSAQGFVGEWREGLVKRTRPVWEMYFLTMCEVALESAHSGHSESAESMAANGGRKGS